MFIKAGSRSLPPTFSLLLEPVPSQRVLIPHLLFKHSTLSIAHFWDAMSSSPREPQDEGEDKQNHDELDEPQTADDAEGGKQLLSLIAQGTIK